MMFFFPEFRVYFQQCCDTDRHQAAGHYDKEEVEVSHGFLQFSGHGARQHHGQGHESRAEGIMRSLLFPLRII